jgi:hypothetical protein
VKAHTLAALGTTFCVFWMLGNGCARHVMTTALPQAPPPSGRMAFVLGEEAKPDDAFCVKTAPGPLYLPSELGLHCTTVLAVRKFIAHLRQGN